MATSKSGGTRKKTKTAEAASKSAKSTNNQQTLSVTTEELGLLRDLMSILLPPDGEYTVATTLAEMTERSQYEKSLWAKLWKACEAANLPVGENAPDFMVAQTMGLGIYQVAKE